jgi:hypothetical protein
MTDGVTLRPAGPGDAALLHAWVNAGCALQMQWMVPRAAPALAHATIGATLPLS